MDRKANEGVGGAALAVVLCASGLVVFSLTPLAAMPSDYAGAVFGSVMCILACLGVGIGIAITRLTTRRPSDGPVADFDDKPPPAG
jgi:hypothetical protein